MLKKSGQESRLSKQKITLSVPRDLSSKVKRRGENFSF